MRRSCHFSSLTKTPSATEPFAASESEYQWFPTILCAVPFTLASPLSFVLSADGMALLSSERRCRLPAALIQLSGGLCSSRTVSILLALMLFETFGAAFRGCSLVRFLVYLSNCSTQGTWHLGEVNEQWQRWQGLCLEGLFRGSLHLRDIYFVAHILFTFVEWEGVTFLASTKVLMPALKMKLQAAGHGGQNILKENSISLNHLHTTPHHREALTQFSKSFSGARLVLSQKQGLHDLSPPRGNLSG